MAKYDVIVIGAGITGLSTTVDLLARGVKSVLLISDTHNAADLPGYVVGGALDNMTRISHAHGAGFAKDFWQFGMDAFNAVGAFCGANQVQFDLGKRERYITSPEELTECRKAAIELSDMGFEASLIEQPPGHHQRIIAIQDEGETAATIDYPSLIEALYQKIPAECLRQERITEVRETKSGVEIRGENTTYRAEMAALCCHVGIGDLLPILKEALVPYADQWASFKADPGQISHLPRFWSTHFGYEWGGIDQQGQGFFGGGRFLRSMAGIGETCPVPHEKVSAFLQKQIHTTFRDGLAGVGLSKSRARIEIRPCDELPIVGPMFGQEKIMVSTGYMGAGISWGYWAGTCLGDFICHGQSQKLPSRLQPKRLRSLEGAAT